MIGSRNYKEAYAILFRDSTVEYVDGAVTYLDRGDRFIREPFSARFASMANGYQFVVSTVHILYGKGVADRTPEIAALGDYWQWLGEVYESTPVIMMGDFNLPPGHPAWAPLKQYAKPLITRGATTLSGTNGKFANLYDNFWVANDTTLPISKSGIVDYPRMIGWNHEKSRAHVSDHAPIYVSLGRAQMNLVAFTSAPNQPAPSAKRSYSERLAGMMPGSSVSPENTKAVVAVAGQVRGNKNSKIYHYPDCPSYDLVSERNRVAFESAEAAVKSGYRMAGNCKQRGSLHYVHERHP